MRLLLTLQNRPGSTISLNYAYELSSAMYRILEKADPAFSAWLHDIGYPLEGRHFKLFTVSGLRFGSGFRTHRHDGTVTLGRQQFLTVSFFVNEAVEKFVFGVFQSQQFGVGTNGMPPVDFSVQGVEVLPTPAFRSSMPFRTLAPIVMSRYEEGKKYEQYLSPEDPDYGRCFFDNLLSKYESARKANLVGNLGDPGALRFRLLSQPKKRGILIKAGTTAQTKVIGYDFEFSLSGPPALLRFGYEAGMGLDNPMFGCVEVVSG